MFFALYFSVHGKMAGELVNGQLGYALTCTLVKLYLPVALKSIAV